MKVVCFGRSLQKLINIQLNVYNMKKLTKLNKEVPVIRFCCLKRTWNQNAIIILPISQQQTITQKLETYKCVQMCHFRVAFFKENMLRKLDKNTSKIMQKVRLQYVYIPPFFTVVKASNRYKGFTLLKPILCKRPTTVHMYHLGCSCFLLFPFKAMV